MRPHYVLAAIWLVAGAVILWRAGVSHLDMINSSEPFRWSEGGEQSVLIFEAIALFVLVESWLRLVQKPQGYWVRKIIAALLLFGSFVWLVMGGPAYEPWYFSTAIAMVLIASIWSLALPRQRITPNSTVERDAPQAARPSR